MLLWHSDVIKSTFSWGSALDGPLDPNRRAYNVSQTLSHMGIGILILIPLLFDAFGASLSMPSALTLCASPNVLMGLCKALFEACCHP